MSPLFVYVSKMLLSGLWTALLEAVKDHFGSVDGLERIPYVGKFFDITVFEKMNEVIGVLLCNAHYNGFTLGFCLGSCAQKCSQSV